MKQISNADAACLARKVPIILQYINQCDSQKSLRVYNAARMVKIIIKKFNRRNSVN